MATYQYSSDGITLSIDASAADLGGHIVEGFADGSMIRVSRTEAMRSLKASGDGKVNTINKRNNRNGTIAFTLEAASPSNKFLRDLALSDQNVGNGIVGVGVKDTFGAEFSKSPQAVLVGPPDMDFSTESGTREWMLLCTELDIAAEGSTQV